MKLKITFIILLLHSIVLIGQTKKEITIRDFFWGENDTSKNSTEIPDKWKNESAVIIYKNINYIFHKFAKSVNYQSSIRVRVKLLDKAAVEEYSEFSFQKKFRVSKGYYKKKGSAILGVKIIKPTGKEIEIDVAKEALNVDTTTKIAIANLEVGDIIDYYIYKEEPFKSKIAFGFDPVEVTLAEEYPIVNLKLFLETENDFFVNFNSYNGASKLKEIPTNKNSLRRYELIENNIEKSEEQRWFYRLLELPSYKFQVYFARSGKFENSAMAFLPKKENIIKKVVTKQEILELYDTRFKPNGNIGNVKSFLKDKTFKSDTEKVTEVYYYMRHFYLTRFIEAFIADKADIIYPYNFYGNNPVFIENEKQFINHFTTFLKRHDIDYEIVVAEKRFDGNIKDLLIEKNVNVLLKIHTTQPLYATYFGPNTSINQYSSFIDGTDVYLLTKTKNRIDNIKDGKLPSSTYAQNETKKEINISINDDFSTFNLHILNKFKGNTKADQQYDRLIVTDYIYEDYQKYDTKSLPEIIKNKKIKAKVTKELNALFEKYKTTQKEEYKAFVKEEFNAQEISNYKYKILETGHYGFDTYFTFNESFTLKNSFIKKAGTNYIIEIGKFIGGQINLKEKERKRTGNIYLKYPRSFKNKIILKIPNGYTVSGLDKLNKSVDNSTGSFTSTATIKDNLLTINTSKQYKNNYEPKAHWNLMIDFLDEAYQFTNEKILLKKK